MSIQPAGRIPQWTLGERLRKAREDAGLEQIELADRIGISRGSVSNYENDVTQKVKPIVTRAWALATGVDLHWLETGEDRPFPGPGGRVSPEAEHAVPAAWIEHATFCSEGKTSPRRTLLPSRAA